MPVVALMSPKGGVGKTTLTANLAATLGASSQDAERILAIDLDPQNALRFHHRMHPGDQRGLVPSALAGGDLADIIYQGPYRVDCLPYGVTTEQQRQAFEAQLAQDPNWLRDALQGIERETVLVDTPPGPTVYMRQALAVADLVIVVLLADAASFVTLESMSRYIDDYCPPGRAKPELRYLINQVDNSKTLNRDVIMVLRNSLPEQDKLLQVHYDSAMEEALACHKPLGVYQPSSVAAQDLGEIAEWLKTQ